MTQELRLADAEATRRLGSLIADAAEPGLVIALYGEVGAGKTTLCQGFIERRTGIAGAPSPTFTLLQAYPGALYHLDLYRLEETDLREFGIEEILAPDAVLLVEWPERAGGNLPPERLEIWLRAADGGRTARLVSRGEAAERLLGRLRWAR